MFNCVLFLQIKHILTKKNFEMYFRAGKTNKFSVFHVENGEIQSMLWFYVNVEIRGLKTNFFYDLCKFSMKLSCFSMLILSKLLMFYANKCLILSSFWKLKTKRTEITSGKTKKFKFFK